MAHILIIEDEKAMSDLVSIRFKVEGFEVDQAFTLNEAKQKLMAGSKFDVVLTDYLLPDGDLVEFLTQMRTDPTLKDLPVVIMTNYVEDLNNDKLKSLGVLDVLIKYQVVPAQMVARIKQILGTP
jgi:CheY-like chemotaxis protein